MSGWTCDADSERVARGHWRAAKRSGIRSCCKRVGSRGDRPRSRPLSRRSPAPVPSWQRLAERPRRRCWRRWLPEVVWAGWQPCSGITTKRTSTSGKSDPQWRHRVDRPPRHRRAVRGRHRYYAPALRSRRLRLAISVATSLAPDSSSALAGGSVLRPLGGSRLSGMHGPTAAASSAGSGSCSRSGVVAGSGRWRSGIIKASIQTITSRNEIAVDRRGTQSLQRRWTTAFLELGIGSNGHPARTLGTLLCGENSHTPDDG